MSFSSYKIIILNDEIEKGEKKNDNRINEKNVNFKKLYDFKNIFSKACNSSSSLNKSRFSKSSTNVNNFDS